jgi:hypothetical protein
VFGSATSDISDISDTSDISDISDISDMRYHVFFAFCDIRHSTFDIVCDV